MSQAAQLFWSQSLRCMNPILQNGDNRICFDCCSFSSLFIKDVHVFPVTTEMPKEALMVIFFAFRICGQLSWPLFAFQVILLRQGPSYKCEGKKKNKPKRLFDRTLGVCPCFMSSQPSIIQADSLRVCEEQVWSSAGQRLHTNYSRDTGINQRASQIY